MGDHADTVRHVLESNDIGSTAAALAALDALVAERDELREWWESERDDRRLLEAELDEARREAVQASEDAEKWRRQAGVTEYHQLRRTATEKRLADVEERAEAAEADRDAAIKTLETIADADYRGNRSGESVAAHLFLVSIGRRQ